MSFLHFFGFKMKYIKLYRKRLFLRFTAKTVTRFSVPSTLVDPFQNLNFSSMHISCTWLFVF
jgi:hypothetical protein